MPDIERVISARNGARLLDLIARNRNVLSLHDREDMLFCAANVQYTEEGLGDVEFERSMRSLGWRGLPTSQLEMLGWLRTAYDLGRGARIVR